MLDIKIKLCTNVNYDGEWNRTPNFNAIPRQCGPLNHYLNKLGKGPFHNATCQISHDPVISDRCFITSLYKTTDVTS